MGDFLVNTTTTDVQFQPSVESSHGTNYLTVWSDASTADIKGQLLGVTGAKVGDEFTVNQPTASNGNTNRQWPAISFAGSSSFAVWAEVPFNTPPPVPSIKLQRYFDGQPSGGEVQVNTADIDPSTRPSVTRMIDGGCLVTWLGSSGDQRIRAQRFSPEGAKAGPEIAVNTTEGFHRSPAVTILADGNYVIAWTKDPSAIGGGRLTLRVFDFQGTPQGDEVEPNAAGFQGRNSLTLLDNGRFVVAHIDKIQPSDLGEEQSTVEASIYEPNGTEFTSVTAGTPKEFTRSSPALAPLPGGRFVLGWVEKSAITFDTVPTVMGKVCSDSQGSLTDKVQVSTATSGVRFHLSAATAFGSGTESTFLTWSDDSQTDGDTSGFAVRGRAFQISAAGALG